MSEIMCIVTCPYCGHVNYVDYREGHGTLVFAEPVDAAETKFQTQKEHLSSIVEVCDECEKQFVYDITLSCSVAARKID